MNLKRVLVIVAFIFISAPSIKAFVLHKFSNDTCIALTDTLPAHKDFVIITVHCAEGSEPYQLWRLSYNDSSYIGKTSHSFYTHRFSSEFGTPRLHEYPQIEVTRKSLNLSSTDTIFHISYGAIDSDYTSPRFYEIAYFPYSLSFSKALSFQTYLAIKFGITLDMANYTTPDDTILWSNSSDLEYYNRVVGIGCDTTYSLNQTQSVQNEEAPTLILYKDNLSIGEYYLMGDNGASCGFVTRDTLSSVLSRTWKIRPYVTDTKVTPQVNIKVLPSSLGCNKDDFALVQYQDDINSSNYQILQPDSTDSDGYLYFHNIDIDRDNSNYDYFGIISTSQVYRTKSSGDTQNSQNSQDNQNEQFNNTFISGSGYMNVSVYPNPSTGPYNIEISLPEIEDVSLRIIDSQGRIIEEKSFQGSSYYTYQGDINTPQLYIFEITTAQEQKQIKYLVR